MHYSYIIYSPVTRIFFISSSDDLILELKLHNQGKIAASVQHKPWKLVWYAGFTTSQQAMAFTEFLHTREGQEFSKKWLVPAALEEHVIGAQKPPGATMCPVCNGLKEAPTRSYFDNQGERRAGLVAFCLTCKGTGWVVPRLDTEVLE